MVCILDLASEQLLPLRLLHSAASEKVAFIWLKLNKVVTLILGIGDVHSPLFRVKLSKRVFLVPILLCIYVNRFGEKPKKHPDKSL